MKISTINWRIDHNPKIENIFYVRMELSILVEKTIGWNNMMSHFCKFG